MGFVFLTKISDEHFIFNRLCLHIMYINTHKHIQYKTQFNHITNTFCKIEDNHYQKWKIQNGICVSHRNSHEHFIFKSLWLHILLQIRNRDKHYFYRYNNHVHSHTYTDRERERETVLRGGKY